MALSFNLMFKIKHCWKLSQSGTYGSKSAYAAFFEALSSSLLGGGSGEVGILCAASFSSSWVSVSDAGQQIAAWSSEGWPPGCLTLLRSS
jgi:hypothetical protein